jgi:hypothetical protein
MKKITAILLSFIATVQLSAQVGFYKTEGKQGGESIEILKDNRFIYTNQTAWAKSTTEGKWSIKGNTLVLHSDKQLIYNVVESRNDNSPALYVEISAASQAVGPKTMEKVILSKDLPFKKDNSRALAYLEQYNKIANTGTTQQRDSLRQAYTPQYFVCDDYEGIADTVRVFFDKKEVIYPLKDKAANVLSFDFTLEINPLYRYFKDEEWEFVGKKELKTKDGASLKKGKK